MFFPDETWRSEERGVTDTKSAEKERKRQKSSGIARSVVSRNLVHRVSSLHGLLSRSLGEEVGQSGQVVIGGQVANV